MTRTPAGDGHGQGLYASLRRLLGTVLEIVQVRLELAAVELEEEKLRLFDALLRALIGLLLLGIALVLLACLIVLVVGETWRVPAVATMVVLCIAGGLWALQAARRSLRSPGGLFGGTRAELASDRAALAPDGADLPR